jgi:hypothetical protein
MTESKSLPIAKILEFLFDQLVLTDSVEELKDLQNSLASICRTHPSVWASVIFTRLSNFQISQQQSEWKRFLAHLGSIRPFPEGVETLEPIVDMCVTSLFSVESSIREASLRALMGISATYSDLVLSKLSFALKIYRLSNEVVLLVENLLVLHQDIHYPILGLLSTLLQNEDFLKPEFLGMLSTCISQACETLLGSHPSMERLPSPAPEGRSTVTDPELMSKCVDIYGILSPFCWRKDYLSSPCLFEITRATCHLMSILPESVYSEGSIHSMQTALLRIAVHARDSYQLVNVIDAISVLTSAGLFQTDLETCRAILPILVDITVALGPLSLMAHRESTTPVEVKLRGLWSRVPSMTVSVIIDRIYANLSQVDRIVCLNFLRLSIERKKSIANPEKLVQCIETMCGQIESSPFFVYSVLSLIRSSIGLEGFSLSVPMIDYVIQRSLEDKTNSDEPSTLRSNWFVENRADPVTGPSVNQTRTYAQNLLTCLSETDFRGHLRERVLAALKSMPIVGLLSLIESLVAFDHPMASRSSSSCCIDILAWYLTLLADDNPPRLWAKLLSVLGFESPEAGVSLVRVCDLNTGLAERIFNVLLSCRFLSKIPQSRLKKLLSLATSLVKLLPDSVAERAILAMLKQSDQEICGFVSGNRAFIDDFGRLIGEVGNRRLPEYLRILSESSQFISGSSSRLIVIIGIKKNSSEIISCIIRSSLGYSSEDANEKFYSLLKSTYLEPCLDTLIGLAKPASGIEPQSLITLTTLSAIPRIVGNVKRTAVDEEIGSIMNKIISLSLPLIVFRGDPSEGYSIPLVSLRAIEAVAALASVVPCMSTINLDNSIQYGVSLLVHGIAVFSTIDTSKYSDRIDSVSNLLVAVLKQPSHPWMGLCKLAQLLGLAGTSSPLPILRIVTLKVFLNVVATVVAKWKAFETSKIAEWFDCVLLLIPRLADPVTRDTAQSILEILLTSRGLNPQSKIESVVASSDHLPDALVPSVVQLLLQCASDGYHDSGVYALGVLDRILNDRGDSIGDPAPLVSLMISQSEKFSSVQEDIIRCITTFSSKKLEKILREILDQVIACNGFNDSQVHTLKAIVKQKPLLVPAINYLTDVMINGGSEIETDFAAHALEVTLSVDSSLVSSLIKKSSHQLLAAALMHSNGQNAITTLVLSKLSIPTTTPISSVVSTYISVIPEIQVDGLATFALPFLFRPNQKTVAQAILCEVIKSGKLSQGTLRDVSGGITRARSIDGLEALFKRKIFGVDQLDVLIELLSDSQSLPRALEVLVQVGEACTRPEAKIDLKRRLLGIGPLLCNLISDGISFEEARLNSMVFSLLNRFVSSIAQIASFMPRDDTCTVSFMKLVEDRLLVEIEIRNLYFDSLGESDEVLLRSATALHNLTNQSFFGFSHFENVLLKYFESLDLYSRTSPSRSPLVIEGAARIAVEIANRSGSDERNCILSTLMRYMKTNRKNFLLTAARDGIITSMGSIVFVS